MAGVLCIDGGMGHQLRRMGVTIEGKIGSLERFLNVATANVNKPGLVEKAHVEFLKSGAQVITTNSYACIPNVLANMDGGTGGKEVATHADLEKYIVAAGKCASNAKRAWLGATGRTKNHACTIAASIPPLNASYRHELVGKREVLNRDYKFITKTIAPYVDIFLCETMSTIAEALAAGTAAAKFNKPVWVSFTVSDDSHQLGRLRSGESISHAVRECVNAIGPNLTAVLCNCSSPKSITVATREIVETLTAMNLTHKIKVGAYANGFEATEKLVEKIGVAANRDTHISPHDCSASTSGEYRADLTPALYLKEVEKWVKLGASIIGGCCGVFPEHIEAVSSHYHGKSKGYGGTKL